MNNADEDIAVATKDGRKFRFDRHDYNIIADSDGNQVLSGKGKSYHQGSSQVEEFEGEIPIMAIETISTVENPTLFYVKVFAMGLVAWLVFRAVRYPGHFG